ncbi:MAG: T9SS type A sorting domain-containing protein [Ignavibacteriales bacterium]|nr:T9SS type A sorting domain-containing protein [Ignavibacteriales bacterium]
MKLNFPASLYYYPRTSSITSIKSFGLKENFKLEQNYPNPFNPITTIQYTISTSASLQKDFKEFVTLKIYDVLGKEINTLVSKNQSAGNYLIQFDASNLTSGIYYYQLTLDDYKKTNKMVLLR